MSPAYNASPGTNTPVRLALEGQINYAFGSKAESQADTLMQVTFVAAAAGTGTVTVQVREGNIPTVGSLITIRGTSTSAGAFNVVNAVITAVSINATTGVGTIQFALGGTVTTTADAGMAYVPVPYVFETLANGASQAFAIQVAAGENDNQKTIAWQTIYGTAPAGITVQLQMSEEDTDSGYTTIDSSNSTSGEVRFYSGVASRFIRFNVTGFSGPGTGAVIFWL